MDKIKVHELAKKLKVNSKDVIEKASKLGIVLKSHLSTITKEEAEKIAKSMGKTDKEKNEVKKEIVSDKPVIMRRTVIINDNDEEKRAEQKNKNRKNDVGFVEKNRKKDYNIVYRNKQSKPMSVAELFGIPQKKEEKKVEEVKPVIEEKKAEKPVKEEVIENEKKVVEEKKVMKEEIIRIEIIIIKKETIIIIKTIEITISKEIIMVGITKIIIEIIIFKEIIIQDLTEIMEITISETIKS